jgi:hypothetical protein
MTYAKLHGKYIGVEPGTTHVYADRTAGGSWEELDIAKRDDGKYIVTFRSGQLVLSIQPDGRLETRPLGTDGPWEQLTIKDGVLSREGIGTTLELEGFVEVPTPKPLVRATINGYYSNVFMKGESGFLDLYRLILGQDIKPLLLQSQDIGSNGRRNFFMTSNTAKAAGLPPFNPDDHSNYFDKVEELLRLYGDYGLYLYSCIFPDNGLFPSWANQTQKQIDHWNKIGEIARKYNNWWGLELTNEIDAKTYNQVDITRFSRISGVICCSGSITDYGIPADLPNQWDVIDFHQVRQYTKSVTDACLANFPPREHHGKATMLGEPLGFGSKAENPNREDNPRIAKEMAGSARGTAAALIYHTQHGGFSQLYDDTEWKCGREWFGQLQGV